MAAGLLAVKRGFILFIKSYQFPLQINTLERETRLIDEKFAEVCECDGWVCDLEIETRLIDEKFVNTMGEYVTSNRREVCEYDGWVCDLEVEVIHQRGRWIVFPNLTVTWCTRPFPSYGNTTWRRSVSTTDCHDQGDPDPFRNRIQRLNRIQRRHFLHMTFANATHTHTHTHTHTDHTHNLLSLLLKSYHVSVCWLMSVRLTFLSRPWTPLSPTHTN